jgi:hypothetical protein
MELVWAVWNFFARVWTWYCSLGLTGQIIVFVVAAVLGWFISTYIKGRKRRR